MGGVNPVTLNFFFGKPREGGIRWHGRTHTHSRVIIAIKRGIFVLFLWEFVKNT
jgi:hypothetical protein